MSGRHAILFVHGGDVFARDVFRRERRGYWTQALPLVLEKHGFVDVAMDAPSGLEAPASWERADVVLVGRLPDSAWTPRLLARLVDPPRPVVVEGPLPPRLRQALGVTAAGRLEDDISVRVRNKALLAATRRYGVSPRGGSLGGPRTRPVDRDPRLDWTELNVPISEAQAEAWRAKGWDVERWEPGPGAGEVLAWLAQRGNRTERSPAVMRQGNLVGCAFGLFAFLGQRHTAEPFDGSEHRSYPRTIGLEALLLGIIDELNRLSGTTRARLLPWPHGATWVRNIRHDFDRLISQRAVADVVRRHAAEGSAATWYWRARHAAPDLLQEVVGAPGHEVALHAERLWADGGDRELKSLSSAAGTAIQGSSAHGAPDCFRYQGAPNALWANARGLAYTELIGHSHMHPHRFASLSADGRVAATSLICLPHHESFDLSTRKGDVNAAAIQAGLSQWIETGSMLQVMNHPDQNINELFDLLGEMPTEGRLDCTAAEAVSWWSRTHVVDEISLRRVDATRFELTSRRGADGVVVELLTPDGRVRTRTVDLVPGAPTVVSVVGEPHAESRPKTWAEMAEVFAESVRSYHRAHGRAVDSGRVLSTIRTNSELVPTRGDQLMRLFREFGGAEIAGRRVLEVGCGFGALAVYLAWKGWAARVTAVDIRSEFIASARDSAERLGFGQAVHFVESDMTALSQIPSRSADIVLLNNAFIYLTTRREMGMAIGEFYRVLKPGGCILFFHASKWRWTEPFSGDPLIHLVPSVLARPLSWLTGWKHNHGRVRLVSARELRAHLRRAGFEDVRAKGVGERRNSVGLKVGLARFYAAYAQRPR